MKLAILLLLFGVSCETKVFPGSMNFDLAAFPANELCVQQVAFLQENQRALWVLEMIDSWGTFPPSGTFSGNLFDFGNFDQCIELRTELTPVGVIVGQHCTLLVPHNHHENERSAKFMPPSRK